MDRNKLYRLLNGREVIRRLREVTTKKTYSGGVTYESQIAGAKDKLLFKNTYLIGKLEETEKIVRILSYSENVMFDDEKHWFLIDMEMHKNNSLGYRWIKTNTRFLWIREFILFM